MNKTSIILRDGFTKRLKAFIKYPARKTYSNLVKLWSRETKSKFRAIMNRNFPLILCPENLGISNCQWNGKVVSDHDNCLHCPLFSYTKGKVNKWGWTRITSSEVCLISKLKSARKLSEKIILAVQIEAALENSPDIFSEINEDKSGVYGHILHGKQR